MGAEQILSILAGPSQGQIKNTNDRKGNPLLL